MNKDEEIAILRRKLEARRGQTGFAENVRAIEQRLRELEGGR